MPGQAQAFFADGTPIPESDLSKAIAEGKAHFERGAEVLVRDAEGRPGTVKGEDVAALLASGGGLETGASIAAGEAEKAQQTAKEEALDRLTSPTQAYLGYQEAIARGATLGLSDAALTGALGDDYRQGALARSQNPATAIPEFGGALGSMVGAGLVTGGTGTGAGVARAATAGGRLLEAAGGAGEALGAAGARGLGLGSTGAKALSLLGRGAAEGALIDVGQEVSAASLEDRDLTVDKLMAAAGHGALAGGVLNVATGGAGYLLGRAGKSLLSGMGEGGGFTEAAGKYGRKAAFKDATGDAVAYYNKATNYGRNPERIERIGQKLLDSGVTGEAPLDGLKIVTQRLEESGQNMRRLATTLDEMGTKISPARILAQVDEQVAKLRAVDLQDFKTIANQVERKVKPMRERAAAGEDYSFTKLWELRQAFDKTVKHAEKNAKPATDELRTLRGFFDNALDEAVGASPDKTALSIWKAAKEDYSDFRLARDALQDLATRREKNRSVSLTDTIMTGPGMFLSAVLSGGSALATLAGGAAASFANKQLRERGPGALAKIADRISKLDRRTDKAIAAAIEGRPKDLPELPKRTIPLLAVLESPDSEPIRSPSKQRDRYEQTLRLVRDLGSDTPSKEASARLGNATLDLAEDLPELASLLQARVAAAAKALNARAPMPMQKKNPLQQNLEDRRIPAGLIAKWLREVDAADAPESIWHDMARGRVPREKIEIVKLTSPHLFNDWRSRVMTYVAERGEKLSRPQRIRLSLAFDFTGDPSVDPFVVARAQQEYAAEKQAQAQQQPAMPQGGELSGKLADDLKPPTERLLMTG